MKLYKHISDEERRKRDDGRLLEQMQTFRQFLRDNPELTDMFQEEFSKMETEFSKTIAK